MFQTFEELMGGINKEEIEAEILKREEGDKELKDYELTEVKSLIWLAGEKWLLRDLTEFTIIGTEVDILTLPDKNGYKFHAFIDVTGHIKGVKKPFDKYQGLPYCIDWKTTKNELNTLWRQRLISSWQWQNYAHLTGAKIFIYRGISRLNTLTELILKVPEINSIEVEQFNASIGVQIKELITNNFEIWPRNKPFACGAYGRNCIYLSDCDNFSMERKVPIMGNLSYSLINKFMLCPEKARREMLEKQEGIVDETDESNFGKAFHRGIASLWKQAFSL